MLNYKIAVGIDISLKKFNAAIVTFNHQLETKVIDAAVFENNDSGFSKFNQWVKKLLSDHNFDNIHFAMEATSVFHENLAYFLFDKGYNVYVIQPTMTKNFFKSLGLTAKNDKVDAKIIARFILFNNIRKWSPAHKTYLKLRKLTRSREKLIKIKTMISNSLTAEKRSHKPDKEVIKGFENSINAIDKQVNNLEKKAKDIVNNDPELKKRIGYITSIPGVGFITAVTLVAETLGFENFSSIKKLTSYAGYDVVVYQSGQIFKKRRISKRGNRHIRRIMFSAASSFKRSSMTGKQFYQNIYKRKNIRLVANVALQRKLLGIIFTLWKNQTTFVDNFKKES